ncbi:MAG: UDP-N-acetylmuramoyl-L-alanine--D-glutamate ligase [Erysipelotrichaceae bacterium]|nr:UDP-N-acetylmuramoyl-L-alanine--D-glutamate ligase [Erysipelotrichaceae bacterium]MDY6034475.1 UDP-N-acetylmuramoyl-L-alanine--D-glutamate ligase [Bulleidia sp.]
MSLQAWIDEFSNRKIMIWGYGKEGKATYQFIRRILPQQVLTIVESQPGKSLDQAKLDTVYTECLCQDDVDFNKFDMILKSPGIVIPEGLDTSKITGEAELFIKHYRDHIVGVTGTKGKSTTTSLIAAILKEKYHVCLVGNIGIPCFEAILEMEEGAYAALELSCHQLEICRYSPKYAVFLNLYEEHLDHYKTMEKYGLAKSHIFTNQLHGDVLIIHQDLTNFIQQSINTPYLIGKDITAVGKTLHIPSHTLDASNAKLIGEHNYCNLAVANMIGNLLGVSDEQVHQAIANFRPLAHRLEDLGEYKGIRYINDSISTIGQSCIQALESIDNVDTVLVGGMDRGIEYDEIEEYLSKRKDVQVIFMYATGKRIYHEMENKGLLRDGLHVVEDLQQAVTLAKSLTAKHHACVLSPAASSYDHFKNFEHRGDVFRKLAFEE